MSEDKPTEDERGDKRSRPLWTVPEVKELGIVDGTRAKSVTYAEGASTRNGS
jgi:hypothetical protein